MSLKGPIIYIDDDIDDIELFLSVMNELKVTNKVITFRNCKEAMAYLCETKDAPFVIVCDVNLPVQNGLEFKLQVDENPYLRRKSIPFIFYSTSVGQQAVNYAYTQLSVQGFFLKESNYSGTLEIWRSIVLYWKHCKHPNTK